MAKMYFIALVAPEEIHRQVLEWKNFMKEHYGCVVALRSPSHITLMAPFWLEESLEQTLKDTLTEFSEQKGPFPIQVKNFAAFKPRVIYVSVEPNQELQKLQADLQQSLINKGSFPIKGEDRPFHPHLSIATRDLYKKAFHEAWNIFQGKKYEANWQANGITLLRHNEKNWEVIFTSQFANA